MPGLINLLFEKDELDILRELHANYPIKEKLDKIRFKILTIVECHQKIANIHFKLKLEQYLQLKIHSHQLQILKTQHLNVSLLQNFRGKINFLFFSQQMSSPQDFLSSTSLSLEHNKTLREQMKRLRWGQLPLKNDLKKLKKKLNVLGNEITPQSLCFELKQQMKSKIKVTIKEQSNQDYSQINLQKTQNALVRDQETLIDNINKLRNEELKLIENLHKYRRYLENMIFVLPLVKAICFIKNKIEEFFTTNINRFFDFQLNFNSNFKSCLMNITNQLNFNAKNMKKANNII